MKAPEDRKELLEAVELGLEAMKAKEYIDDVIMRKRASVIMTIESLDYSSKESAHALAMYLRLLRDFERYVQADITGGQIAQEELMKDGDDDE